ncbi:hypothetical protein GA829_30715 [Mesorhizobium sp. INR15]|nr:hypothetical protein GA829_30715 [Mesorhizobium sp. INR15]
MSAVLCLSSPLVGEGGLARSAKTDEGCWTERDVSASWNTPHPTSLREATFSHKGRREGRTT